MFCDAFETYEGNKYCALTNMLFSVQINEFIRGEGRERGTGNMPYMYFSLLSVSNREYLGCSP